MKKLLFIPLIALATFSYAQECTPVTEIDEDFSSFTQSNQLPQKCWSSDQSYPRAHVDLSKQSIQAYTFFSPGVPIYIITPEISEFNDTQKLSFDAFVTSGSAGGGTIQIGTLTDKNDISTFVPVTEVYTLVPEGEAVRYNDIKIGASTTAKYIAFKFLSTIQHSALSLDNVTFKGENLGTDDIIKVEQKVVLYPNPVVDVLNIKTDSKVLSYEVYDLTGRKVSGGTSEKVNVSNLSKGNYIINIVTKDGNTTNKFIKK